MEKGRLVEKTLTSIVRVDEKTPVYNMSVDNTETFFADGFAVHNKSTCVYEIGLHNWPTIARTSDTTARISVAAQTQVRPLYTGRDGMTIVVALESADPQVFRSECAGQWASQCVFVRRNLDISQSYTFNVSGLQPGTLYKMAAKVYPLSLICAGKDTIYLSSCRLTPDPLNIASPGQTKTLRTELNILYPARQTQQVAVSYTSSAPAVATVFSQYRITCFLIIAGPPYIWPKMTLEVRFSQNVGEDFNNCAKAKQPRIASYALLRFFL